MANLTNPTLAILIIGNEILSGRTLDKNVQYIAQTVGKIGVDVLEVRVIPDDVSTIIATVNELRQKFDYVFTTGGIGPTHDDITAECIAKAFGTELHQDKMAYSLLVDYYQGEENLNPGRIKMTMVPKGSELILNPVSAAPGFRMDNVFVMAGVPRIMQGMLENVIPKLRIGKQIVSKTVRVEIAESKIAAIMTDLQKKHTEIQIGSYPYMQADGYDHLGVNVVFRSLDEAAVNLGLEEFVKTLQEQNIKFER